MMSRIGLVASLALMAGCGGGLGNELHPTGSSTIAALQRGDSLVSVNVLEGSISRIDPKTKAVDELQLGVEPSRIAPFGKVVLVSLRGERAVAVVDVTGDKMKRVDTIKTGAEPFGIVADEHARNFWVAVSQENQVVEYDSDYKVVRTFKVAGEPRWLALHPSRDALFVASARGGKLSRIDLKEGTVTDVVSPEVERPVDNGDVVELDHRYTGDPAITPDGDWLVVPGLHLDTTTPVETPDDGGEVPNGYGSGGFTLGRINPTVSVFPLDRHGSVDPDEDAMVVFLAAGVDRNEIARSYPTSVTADPEGSQVAVTMEASNAVMFVDLRPFKGQGDELSSFGGGREDVFFSEPMDMTMTSDTGTFSGGGGKVVPSAPPSQGGMHDRPVVGLGLAAAGPNGVAFTDKDTLWTHSFIDRSLTQIDYAELEGDLNDMAEDHFARGNRNARSATLSVTKASLPDDVEQGLRMFYGARDARMAGFGAGVSCSTCHMDGRDDGLTWTFAQGVRQTPSLAGTVSETFPVTWTDSVDSVATEAQLTAQLRMGGEGLATNEAQAIQAFVDYGRRVDVAEVPKDALARGRDLFNRADVGCAECHSGHRYTDNTSHDLLGLVGVNTPTLTGIAATAPYLHDGSAKTLTDVLDTAIAGEMGDASMLTPAQLADLEAYLQSL